MITKDKSVLFFMGFLVQSRLFPSFAPLRQAKVCLTARFTCCLIYGLVPCYVANTIGFVWRWSFGLCACWFGICSADWLSACHETHCKTILHCLRQHCLLAFCPSVIAHHQQLRDSMHFLTPELLACCQSVKFKPRCIIGSGLVCEHKCSAQECTCVCVCLSLCVCICVFVSVCVCVYFASFRVYFNGIAGRKVEGGRVTCKCVCAGVRCPAHGVSGRPCQRGGGPALPEGAPLRPRGVQGAV